MSLLYGLPRENEVETDFRQKNETSAGLKITFVGMTYPSQRPERHSLSRHFLLGLVKYDKFHGFQDAADHRAAVAKHPDKNTTVLKNNLLAVH